MTFSLTSLIVPYINKFSQRVKTRAFFLYPQNLIISINKGKLSVNTVQPLRFPIPFELITDVPPAISDQKQQYLFTIDTQGKIEDFAEYQSLILATSNYLVVSDSNSGYRVYPLTNMDNLTIDKQTVDNLIKQILPLLDYLPILIILLLFIISTIILPLTRLLSLIILSLVLLCFAKLIHTQLAYGKIYQIGLHSLTFPTLIQIVMTTMGIFPPIPFFNSILFLLYNLVILAELRSTTSLK